MLETTNQMYPTSQRFEKTFIQSIRYRYVNQLFQKRAKSYCRIDIHPMFVMSFKWEKCANFSGFGTSKRNSFSPVELIMGLIRPYLEIEKNNC